MRIVNCFPQSGFEFLKLIILSVELIVLISCLLFVALLPFIVLFHYFIFDVKLVITASPGWSFL